MLITIDYFKSQNYQTDFLVTLYERIENVVIPLGEIIRKRLRCNVMNDAVKINITDKGSCTKGGRKQEEGKLRR